MKKVILATGITLITLTSSVSADEISTLTTAVVKIIKSQYKIEKRLSKIEYQLRSGNTHNKSKKSYSSNEINELKKEIAKLNARVNTLSKYKAKPTRKNTKTKYHKRRKTKEDLIIENFIKE